MGCGSSSASIQEKVSYLQGTPFMLHMNEEELSHFAKFATVRRYPHTNTKIFNEGDKGNEFFIIASGEVDITARDAHHQEQFLCSKKKGDFFGEHGILHEGHVRTATVTSSDACTMLVINQKSYKQYLTECDEKMKVTVQEMIGERMVNVLKKISWLSSLSEWKLQLLGNLFRYRTIQENEVVFSEGDMGRSLFIISQGSVTVSSVGEDGHQLTFPKLTAGAYFGEIALMLDMPRTATVTACERCLLLVLGIDDFRNFLHVVPDLKEQFEKVVKDRTAEHFQKFKVPFFASIPRERFKELADFCSMQRYESGEIIFNEGDAGNAFFLMVYGEVSVRKEGHEVGVLGAGKYFGEIALVTDVPRTATVIAKTKAVLLSLTKESFIKFFASNPEAYADFAIKISRYEVPLRSVLVHRTGREFFLQHLASEYSTENLEFWDEAGRFEVLEGESKDSLRSKASEIISKYVDGNAEKQVNIPSRCKDALMAKFAEPDGCTTRLFIDARNEILKLMSSDSFKRFKESDLFKKLLKAVGTYSDKPIDEDEIEIDYSNNENNNDDADEIGMSKDEEKYEEKER